MDCPGRIARCYGSEGRARHVPDPVVGRGLSRSLADRPTYLPTDVFYQAAGQHYHLQTNTSIEVLVAPSCPG
jgi:hypothetical protein